MKKFIKIVAGLFIVIIILSCVGLIFLMKDIDEGKAVEINSVNIATVNDGEYVGKYSFSRWQSEVLVKVIEGKIIDIKLLSSPLTPDVSKELFDNVIKEQRVDVDVVSGAKVTSKAYLKSIENALSQ